MERQLINLKLSLSTSFSTSFNGILKKFGLIIILKLSVILKLELHPNCKLSLSINSPNLQKLELPKNLFD